MLDDDDPMGTPEPSVDNVEGIEDSITEVSPDASPVESVLVECASVKCVSVECVEMVSSVLVEVAVGPRPSSLPSMHCSAIGHC